MGRHWVLAVLSAFLVSLPSSAEVLIQVTDRKSEYVATPTLDGVGSTVLVNLTADAFGTNPRRVWQVGAWDAASGSGAPVTEDPDGVSWMARSVDVSDDGDWVVFVSPADLTGRNHDESLEIFVVASDKSSLSQITDHPGPANTSWVYHVAISGSGDRIAFIADTDPLGTNPDRVAQVFAVNRDGSGLIQLTQGTSLLSPFFLDVDISDDGGLILFNRRETFTIASDGTNLQQIVPGGSFPYLSGDGSSATFQASGPSASVVDTVTTIERLSEPGRQPTISDDAGLIVFSDDRVDLMENPEGNSEIWKASVDGTSLTAITSTSGDVSNFGAKISGDGSRVVFQRSEPDTLRAIDGQGNNEVLLAESAGASSSPFSPDLTPDGSRAAFIASPDLFILDLPDGKAQRLTDVGKAGFLETPTMTADGETIVFESAGDPFNLGTSGGGAVYAIQADGSDVRLLSDQFAFGFSPTIASNGSWVVYVGGPRSNLWRVRPDGTERAEIIDLTTPGNYYPRIDSAGEWIVFENQGIARIHVDGTGFQQIASAEQFETAWPDISGDGQQIVWSGFHDPVGTNADGNSEIFRYDVATDTIHQVTVTAEGVSAQPRISKDGAWIYFYSEAPFFDENPQLRAEPYRYHVGTGRLERAGGIRRGPTDIGCSLSDIYCQIPVDATGRRAIFAAGGDWAGTNSDYDRELYLIDMGRGNRIEADKQAPTVVTWDADPRFVRYDVIRGDVANLARVGDEIDLGPVACLEEDSPDTDTRGFEDDADPEAGQVLFYLFRGTQGDGDAKSDWGFGTGAAERMPGIGACGSLGPVRGRRPWTVSVTSISSRPVPQ